MGAKYELYLDRNIPSLTDEMLIGIDNVRSINIPKEIIRLPIGAFHRASKLKKVYFEANSRITKLPDNAFSHCSNLSKINQLPEGLISIGAFVFRDCFSLNEITIPKEVDYIEPNAFDGWKVNQTINCYKLFQLDDKCQAHINLISSGDQLIETSHQIKRKKGELGYFIVKAKCGHVGRPFYVPIDFPVITHNIKEAANIAIKFPRVKHNHKDAILSITEVSFSLYQEQIEKNKDDPFLKIKSKHEQDIYMDEIEKRKVEDNHYHRNKDKRKTKIIKKSDASIDYKKKKLESYS